MQHIIDRLVRVLLKTLLSEQAIRDLVSRLESLAHTAVASLFAVLLAWLLSLLNQPDDLILGFLPSNDAERSVGAGALLVLIVQAIYRLLPFLLSSRFVFLLAAAISSSAMATGIEGPSTIQTGKLAVYRAVVSEGSGVAWLVFPEDVADYIEAENKLILTGPPGRYSIHLLEFSPSSKPPMTKVRKTLDIQGGGPDPQPPPGPPTPPSPPDGRFKLAKFARDYVTSMSEQDKAKAPIIAERMESLASALAAGGLKTPNELLIQTRDILNSHGEAWQLFRSDLSLQLERHGFRARPKEDFVDAWREIALGLRP